MMHDAKGAIDKALAGAGHHSADNDGGDGDEGIEAMRQRHHEELSLKHRMFLRAQAEAQQAHMMQQAARIHALHMQHGPEAVHELGKGLLIAQGPDHIRNIAQHLIRAGAGDTAKALATGAMQSR